MAIRVYVYPKVDRQLAALEKQGKTPFAVAGRARRVIDSLARGMGRTNDGLLRRKTDRRVKNCLKFDLGQGFRLLCIKESKILYILFVGDHDSCDNWLDNYTKISFSKLKFENRSYVFDKKSVCQSKEPVSAMEFFDDSGFTRISQRDLRRVFRGLIQ